MTADCNVSFIFCPTLKGDTQESVKTETADCCTFRCVCTLMPNSDGTFALSDADLDELEKKLGGAARRRVGTAIAATATPETPGGVITRGTMLTEFLASAEEEVGTLNVDPTYKDSVFFKVNVVKPEASEDNAAQTAKDLFGSARYSEDEQRVLNLKVTTGNPLSRV